MKKLFISIVALAVMAITANAQWYVGGNVGLSAKSTFSVNGGSIVGWNISPEGGYVLNETMLVGAALNLGGSATQGINVFNFNIAPYYRWKFWGVNSLNFWLEGGFAIGSESTTQKVDTGEGIAKINGTAVFWGVAVAPLISYNIDDRWSIVTKIASLGINGVGAYDVKVNGQVTGKTDGVTNFSFMAINGPSIGLFYTF